jgi:hypothetical protein
MLSKVNKMNYRGQAIFDFSIIRTDDFGVEQEIFLKIKGSAYFQHGKINCEIDDCYPDESETEIISVTGPDGKDWESYLSDSERDMVLNYIAEEVTESDDGPDPDDYED